MIAKYPLVRKTLLCCYLSNLRWLILQLARMLAYLSDNCQYGLVRLRNQEHRVGRVLCILTEETRGVLRRKYLTELPEALPEPVRSVAPMCICVGYRNPMCRVCTANSR